MTRLFRSWQAWVATVLLVLAATALLYGTPLPCENRCQTTGETR